MNRMTRPDRPARARTAMRGHVAIAGIILMVLLVVGFIGFMVWTASVKEQPIVRYTPPEASADDPIAAGKSTKEIYQDVSVLQAAYERGSQHQKTVAKVLEDKPLTIGNDQTTAVVEEDRLSKLQTDFTAECERRIKQLNAALPLLNKLTEAQRPVTEGLINKQLTDLTAMKARVAAATTTDGFAAERQQLNEQYNAYLLTVLQANLLMWGDDQAVMETKVNVVGGKFQERINEASGEGKATATAQSALNGYQSSKTAAIDLTGKVIRIVPTIRPGEHNSNRSVLKTYYDQLTTAHIELNKTVENGKKLAAEVQAFDQKR